MIFLECARAAESGKKQQASLRRAELAGVGWVFDAIQMRLSEGVEAQQERNLSDVGEPRKIPVVRARRAARRLVVVLLRRAIVLRQIHRHAHGLLLLLRTLRSWVALRIARAVTGSVARR